MKYSIRETIEAIEDVTRLAAYMIDELNNHKAAFSFITKYDKEVNLLSYSPFGYKGLNFTYKGYKIRKKPFYTYNIFFVINIDEKEIIILRVLKGRQNWHTIIWSMDGKH